MMGTQRRDDEFGLCDCGHYIATHVLSGEGLACATESCACGGGPKVALREFGFIPGSREPHRRRAGTKPRD